MYNVASKLRPIALLTVLVISPQLFGQSEEDELELAYGDDSFISIATGRSKLITKAPAVASIITAKQIERSGARTIDEVLESVPGLHVSSSSTRLSPVYSIRGIATDKNPQVLVLVNGVATTNLYFGDRGPVSSMPVHAVSRVEIIRGPGSAVYGADAFAGVINIITKKAEDYDGLTIGARIGDFNQRDAWVSFGKTEGVDIAFSLQMATTEGDDDRKVGSDSQTGFDNALGTSASLAPGSLNTQQDRVDINFEVSDEAWVFRYWSRHLQNVGSGPGVALALDPVGEGEINDYLLDFTINDVLRSENWDTSLQFNYYSINKESESVLFPAGTTLPIDGNGNVNPGNPVMTTVFPDGLIGNPDGFEKRIGIDFAALSENTQSHTFRIAFGASTSELVPAEEKNFGPGVNVGELTDVTGTPYIYVKEEQRDIVYVSFQDEIDLAADWDLTAGVRIDDYSDFGSTTNPRLALVWDTSRTLTTKFLYGRAFRAPSFAELYAINNPVVLGNEDLDPETIDTYEVAFAYRPSINGQLGLNIFHYEIKDLIEFVTQPSGASVAQNSGDQTGQGVEFEWSYDATKALRISGNVALVSVEDANTGEQGANFPEEQAYLQLDWLITNNWVLMPQIHYVGSQNREQDDPRDDLESYTLVNLALTSNFGAKSGFLWQIGVNNLTDEDYADPSPYEGGVPSGSFMPDDFPAEGRQFYALGQYTF
jgi:outer membrane receptor for ferrienterochelin and colicins